MSGLFGTRKDKKAEPDRITDSLIGTGDQMCTCATVVADLIIAQEEDQIHLAEKVKAIREVTKDGR